MLGEGELTHDALVRTEGLRPLCEGAARGSLFPSMSLQEVAPHPPLEIATRRSPGRIVINQRASRAWAASLQCTSTQPDHMKQNHCVPRTFT